MLAYLRATTERTKRMGDDADNVIFFNTMSDVLETMTNNVLSFRGMI
jgi:hypothetical protein